MIIASIDQSSQLLRTTRSVDKTSPTRSTFVQRFYSGGSSLELRVL